MRLLVWNLDDKKCVKLSRYMQAIIIDEHITVSLCARVGHTSIADAHFPDVRDFLGCFLCPEGYSMFI